MRRKRLDQMDCSIAKALDVVGDPWTLLIIRDALLGVRRFEDFFTRLGVPRATLIARLDRLVESGVMVREQYHANPPRARYELTDKGRALRPVILTLMQWGDEWARTDEPPTTLVDPDTGRTIRFGLADLVSGRPLADMQVRTVGHVTDGIRADGEAGLEGGSDNRR